VPNQRRQMKHYELLYITDPSNDDGIEDVKRRIEGIITGREGSVISFEKVGKKRLAYPIQKRQYGIYFLVNLTGDGRIVQALDYFLRLNSLVLRHLILTLSDKQMQLKDLTIKIQKEEAERMRSGGRPLKQAEKVEVMAQVRTALEKSNETPETPAEKAETPETAEETVSAAEDTVTDGLEENIDNQEKIEEKPVQSETETVAEELDSSDEPTETSQPAPGQVDDVNEKKVE